MAEQKTKPHSCNYPGCTRSFDRPYRLAQHLLTHNNVKAFACPENGCTKSYTSKSHLDRHINSSHKHPEKNYIYSCPTCFKTYANRQNLKRHIKVTHTLKLQTTLMCDICRIEFNKKHHLSSHMFEHTGIKPFSCDECHMEFVTLYEKRRHRRFHRTHICTDCGEKFNRWSKFKEHTRMHLANKEYVCDGCGRKFKQRVHIVRHMKTHSPPKVRGFPCPYENCGRSYSRNSNLTQHILMKHKKLLHKCEICNAGLSTKAKLNEHVMKLHSGLPLMLKKPVKTKASGRKPRKDIGLPKSSTAEKLAGLHKTLQVFEERFTQSFKPMK